MLKDEQNLERSLKFQQRQFLSIIKSRESGTAPRVPEWQLFLRYILPIGCSWQPENRVKPETGDSTDICRPDSVFPPIQIFTSILWILLEDSVMIKLLNTSPGSVMDMTQLNERYFYGIWSILESYCTFKFEHCTLYSPFKFSKYLIFSGFLPMCTRF